MIGLDVLASSYVDGPDLSGFPGALIVDTFTRPADPSDMGFTELGNKEWIGGTGTWGVDGSGNAYKSAGGATGRQAFLAFAPPYRIEVTCDVIGEGAGVLFRWNNVGEGWFWNVRNQRLYTINALNFFNKGGNDVTAVAGDKYRIDVYANGDTNIFKNGASLFSYSENWMLSATYIGLLADGPNAKFRDIAVYPLP